MCNVSIIICASGSNQGIGDALFWFTLVPITAGITANMALTGNLAAPLLFLLIFNVAQFAIRYFLMHWSYRMGTDAIDLLTENATEFTRAASILGIFVVGALTSLNGATTVDVQIPNGSTFEAVPIETVISADELTDYESVLFEMDNGSVVSDENGDPVLAGGASVKELSNGSYQIAYNEFEEVPVTIDIQGILDGILPQLIPLALTLMLYLLFIKKEWTPVKGITLLLIIGILGSGLGLFPSIWP